MMCQTLNEENQHEVPPFPRLSELVEYFLIVYRCV